MDRLYGRLRRLQGRRARGPLSLRVRDALPRDGWWTASFNALPNKVEIYCDIATVPRWSDGEVTMIDLDLDVIRMRDGRVILDDEDEFEEHQVRYAYPPDVIENARITAARLMEAVRTRAAPSAPLPTGSPRSPEPPRLPSRATPLRYGPAIPAPPADHAPLRRPTLLRCSPPIAVTPSRPTRPRPGRLAAARAGRAVHGGSTAEGSRGRDAPGSWRRPRRSRVW